MRPFKVGDRVIRVVADYEGVKQGHTYTVRTMSGEGPRCEIQVDYDSEWYTANYFELVTVPSTAKPPPGPSTTNVRDLIAAECDALKAMLLEKNAKYGNSALEPVRIFSKADPIEQLKVRLDDKISRLRNDAAGDNEDAVLDLMGYCILLRVAKRMKSP